MRNKVVQIVALLLACLPLEAQEKASPTRTLSFPRDHGSHRTFETEWWYYTGHLFNETGKPFEVMPHYGFQLTFFRRRDKEIQSIPWQHSYLAHGALTDHREKSYRYHSRFHRGALSLAGADEGRLSVWNGPWRAAMIGGHHVLEYEIPGDEPIKVQLVATSPDAPVLQGEKGYSRKGRCDICASHYYSFPYLEVKGQVLKGETIEQLHGIAWMDHEFMTSALDEGQVGWDWFSLASKEWRLMLFQLRGKTPEAEFFSGTLIRGSEVITLKREDFTIHKLEEWRSESGAKYPSAWRIEVPHHGIDINVKSLTPDQEFGGRTKETQTYWEGAVSSPTHDVLGYVEMTGYKEALSGDI